MKRPLGFVVLVYMGGLVMAEFFGLPLPFLFSASLAVAAAALVLRRARAWLLWPLIFLCGWTNLTWRTALLSPRDLRALLRDPPQDVTVRGKLLETPSERIYIHDETESSRTLAQVAVSHLRRDGTWQPAFGQILITTPGTLPPGFFNGEEVEVSGVLAPPRPPLAEGLFDYQTYLRQQGIYFELKSSSAADWQSLSTQRTPPLSDRFLAWAKGAMTRGLPDEDKPLRLLWAMTLGSKDAVTSQVYDPFIQSGTMHIFAISGLHIALIAGILVSLLRVMQVPRFWCGVVVIPLIWFYTAATGWQASAIRSTLMMSIIIGGWSLKRPSDLLNSLAAAALIILLWDPRQLFQASFQLSFFVVLSIALFLPPLEKVRDRWLQPDPLLPAQLIPRWKRWLGTPLRHISSCLATSLAAWLGSWPLTAYYFHLFSPVTLLANLLIVPISSAALACNLGSLICGAWFPWATELFNFSGWLWMWLMMRISEGATNLPGAFFYVRPLVFADFVIYYGALIAVLSGFALAPKRRVWAVACLICIGGFYFWRWHQAQQSTDLTVIPLNGASAIYCDAPGWRDDVLVDCGNANSVEFVLAPFLRAQGVNELPCLALSHGDVRHVGGFESLQRRMAIEQIVTSSARFRSAAYRHTMELVQENPERRRIVRPGDHIAHWTVLHPDPADHFSQADDSALVLRGEFSGGRILLLSDLGRPGQNAVLERNPDLRADIVVAGLPERSEPLCEPLLDAIQPKLIIIADSEYPATKRAGATLRTRLEQRGVPVLYTRQCGAVKISWREDHWTTSTSTGLRIERGH